MPNDYFCHLCDDMHRYRCPAEIRMERESRRG